MRCCIICEHRCLRTKEIDLADYSLSPLFTSRVQCELREKSNKNRRRPLMAPYFDIIILFFAKKGSHCTQYVKVSTAAQD